ncbi:MAG TPA: hypothetical protein VIC84_02845 [Blastocatellia bacterium]
MSRQGLRKHVANFATLAPLLVCLFIASSPRAALGSVFSWQSHQKSITKYQHRNQPLNFDKVKAAGKLIELKAGSESKEDFDGDDDWMRGLAVTFKNTSNKNIVYFQLLLQFPETGAAGLIMSHPMNFGRMPKDSNDRNYDNVLRPGEEVEITLTDDQYGSLRSFLKSRSFDKVSNVRLFLDTVIFDDDIMWAGGDQWRRNPNDPNQWFPINKQ